MSVRNTQTRRYGYRLTINGHNYDAQPLIASGQSLFLRIPIQVPVDSPVEMQWSGPGGIRVESVCIQSGMKAPDGLHACELRLQTVAARDGADALQWYLRSELDLRPTERPETKGAYWSVTLSADAMAPAAKKPAIPKGPSVKIAGQRADLPDAQPLHTGYGPTDTSDILRLLETNHSKVGVYLNVPCAYLVAGASYWGRALRMNERWLQINTNAVVPGLGVRMRADVTLEIDGVKRAVSVHGVMSRKKELAPGGAYKATVALMIRDIDEGESPGLLRYWLEKHIKERSSQGGSKGVSE